MRACIVQGDAINKCDPRVVRRKSHRLLKLLQRLDHTLLADEAQAQGMSEQAGIWVLLKRLAQFDFGRVLVAATAFDFGE